MDFRIWACPFLHSSILVRREAMMNYSESTKQAEDWKLENKILLKWRGGNLPERLVHYRIHSQNLTNSYPLEQRREALKVVQGFPEFSRLSQAEFAEFSKLFNYNLSEITQPLQGMKALLKLSLPNGFRKHSRRRFRWLVTHTISRQIRKIAKWDESTN